jgi:4-amino-4-deoxy-L-arabinose transferase-like glycosyltransferase
MKIRPIPIALSFIFLAALAIRIVAAVRCTSVPDFSDMAAYTKAALAAGFPTSLPPGYPLFLRLIYGLFGAHNYTAVFIAQGLISAVTVLLLYRATAKIGTPRAGLIAAGIAAVYPNFIAYNLTVLTETIGVFFVALLLTECFASIGERRRSIIAALTLIAGAAFRPVILFFAPGALLGLKKRLVFAITIAAIILPIAFSAMLSGSNLHRAARGLYKTYNPKATGRYYRDLSDTELGTGDVPSGAYVKSALEFVWNNKWKTLDIIYQKATIVFSRGWETFVLGPFLRGTRAYYIMCYAFVPIMVLGFAGMIRLYDKRNRILAFLALGYAAIFVVASIFKVRYRLLMEPILIVYAAMLLDDGLGALRRPRFGEWARRLVAPPEPDVDRTAPSSAGRSIRFGRERRQFLALRASKDADILAVILFAALAIRLYLALTFNGQIGNPELQAYEQPAVAGTLGSATPPLYPLFLRAIYAVFGRSNHVAVFAVQGVLNALTVLMMYAAASRLCNRTAGIIAAAITAVYPNFLRYELSLRPASLTVLLAVFLIVAASSRARESLKAAASGIVVGAGVLMQPPLVCFVPGLLATTKRWRLFFIVLIASLVPYTVRNVAMHEPMRPVYQQDVYGFDLRYSTSPPRPWRALDVVYNNASSILARDGVATDIRGSEAVDSAYLAGYGYLIVMVLGIIGLVRGRGARRWTIAAPFILYVVVRMLFSSMNTRSRVPLEPLFILYTSILIGGRWGCTKGEPNE